MLGRQIYLVSFEYFPISNGGLARHAKEIIDRMLFYKRYEAIIAVPYGFKQKLNRRIIKIPCHLFANKFLCYFEFSLKIFLKFRKKINKNKFVYFSSFSYFFIPFLPKIFYIFVTNTLNRAYITNYSEEGVHDRLFRKLIYFCLFNWERFLCRNSQKIFAISQSTKDDVETQYHIEEKKISIIPCGINTKIFKITQPKSIFNKDLLFVGRFVLRKNIFDLVTIMKLLTNVDPNFKLHLVGKGEIKYLKKIKEKISNNNLGENIIIHDYLTDKELIEIYQRAGLFVFASLVEGFGLVLLEAMSKGLPAIAYDVNGVKDVIINNVNGYLVKPFDYRDFKNKILSLNKNNRVYQQMSINAIKRTHDFNWDQSVKNLVIELEKK